VIIIPYFDIKREPKVSLGAVDEACLVSWPIFIAASKSGKLLYFVYFVF